MAGTGPCKSVIKFENVPLTALSTALPPAKSHFPVRAYPETHALPWLAAASTEALCMALKDAGMARQALLIWFHLTVVRACP